MNTCLTTDLDLPHLVHVARHWLAVPSSQRHLVPLRQPQPPAPPTQARAIRLAPMSTGDDNTDMASQLDEDTPLQVVTRRGGKKTRDFSNNALNFFAVR
jgi:hypothetical protein